MFFGMVHGVLSNLAIILSRKRKLVALICDVLSLFFSFFFSSSRLQWVDLRAVIMAIHVCFAEAE